MDFFLFFINKQITLLKKLKRNTKFSLSPTKLLGQFKGIQEVDIRGIGLVYLQDPLRPPSPSQGQVQNCIQARDNLTRMCA
jgi:hypothetical protein